MPKDWFKRDSSERKDKGFFGVFLLLLIAGIGFFFLTGFIQGIFHQISCQQASRSWTDTNPKRYLLLLLDKDETLPTPGEEVHMFGTCR